MSEFEIIEVGPGGVVCNERAKGCKCHLTLGHTGEHVAIGNFLLTWRTGDYAVVKIVMPG